MTVTVGEIRLLAGFVLPYGWMYCDGRAMDTNTYQALSNAIGQTYGSNAPGSFNLPDLRGRVPIHFGGPYPLGISGGVEEVALTPVQIPPHTHPLYGTDTTATQVSPQGNLPAQSLRFDGYQTTVPGGLTLASGSVQQAGGAQPHENLQPFLCLNYIIAVIPAALPAPSPMPKMAAVIRRPRPDAKAKPTATIKTKTAKPKPKAKSAAKSKSGTKAKAAAKSKTKATASRKAKTKVSQKAGPAARGRRVKAASKPSAGRKTAAKGKTARRSTPKKRGAPKTSSRATTARRATKRRSRR